MFSDAPQGNLKQVVRPLEENQELFGAVDLRGAELDFQAERDCLQRQQDAVDLGRADFSLSSPLYLNLFPVRFRPGRSAGQPDCQLAIGGYERNLHRICELGHGQSITMELVSCTRRHSRARQRPTQASVPSHRPRTPNPGSRCCTRRQFRRAAVAAVRGACAACEQGVRGLSSSSEARL